MSYARYGTLVSEGHATVFYEGLDFIYEEEITKPFLISENEVKVVTKELRRIIEYINNISNTKTIIKEKLPQLNCYLWFLCHWRHYLLEYEEGCNIDNDGATRLLLYDLLYLFCILKLKGIEKFVYKIFGVQILIHPETSFSYPKNFSWNTENNCHIIAKWGVRFINQDFGREYNPISVKIPQNFTLFERSKREWSDSKLKYGSYGSVRFQDKYIYKKFFYMSTFIKEFVISKILYNCQYINKYLPIEDGILSEMKSKKGKILNDIQKDNEYFKEILTQGVVALYEMYINGVLHHDITKNNIIRRKECLKLIDFSLSSVYDDACINYKVLDDMMCTTTTRPPEYEKQVTKELIDDMKSHVFQLGASILDIFGLLCNRDRTISNVKNKNSVPEKIKNCAELNDENKQLILGMIELDRNKRLSMEELLEKLEIKLEIEIPDERFSKYKYKANFFQLYENWKPQEGGIKERLEFFNYFMEFSRFHNKRVILPLSLLRGIMLGDLLYKEGCNVRELAFFCYYIALSLNGEILKDVSRNPSTMFMKYLKEFLDIEPCYYIATPFYLNRVLKYDEIFFSLYSKNNNEDNFKTWCKYFNFMLESPHYMTIFPLELAEKELTNSEIEKHLSILCKVWF